MVRHQRLLQVVTRLRSNTHIHHPIRVLLGAARHHTWGGEEALLVEVASPDLSRTTSNPLAVNMTLAILLHISGLKPLPLTGNPPDPNCLLNTSRLLRQLLCRLRVIIPITHRPKPDIDHPKRLPVLLFSPRILHLMVTVCHHLPQCQLNSGVRPRSIKLNLHPEGEDAVASDEVAPDVVMKLR